MPSIPQIQIDSAHQTLESIHDGYMDIGQHFSNLLNDLPVSVYWGHFVEKTQDLIWDGCNSFEASIFNRTDPEQMIGRSVKESFLCEEQAEAVIEEEKNVIIHEIPILNRIRVHTSQKGQNLLLATTRIPRYDSNRQIIGALAINFVINGFRESKIVNLKQMMGVCFDDIHMSLKNKKNYYLSMEQSPVKITSEQAACLTYLSMGKTIKQIANILDCSSRTIEDHIKLLKRKLDIYSTSELIDTFWRNPIRWF